MRDNLVRLADLAIDYKVEYLVTAGDLFENNEAKPYTIAFVAQQVKRLADHGIRTIGIAGDHDRSLKGESWYRIAGLVPAQAIPEFTGIDYFDYSSVEPEELAKMLLENKDPEKVLWIVLHCQFPQLFEMAQPKKLIDFNKLDLFTHFPNLQGIIAGDLHFAPETRAYGIGKEAYAGYPGSLGITDISESIKPRRVLYCDGTELKSVVFPQRRNMYKINFRGEAAVNFDVSYWLEVARTEAFKPLLHITWDSSVDTMLHKIFPLYEAALVFMHQAKVGEIESEGAITDRTQISTEVKIEQALRSCEGVDNLDEDLVKLTLDLITSAEPKVILDNYKKEFNI